MNLTVIPFEQPVGKFLLTVMNAADIIRISYVSPRQFDAVTLRSKGGIQRVVSDERVAEIAQYASTVDATFPTPILLALSGDHCNFVSETIVDIVGDGVADIVDGQHRVRGLMLSGRAADFSIPVVFILDPSEEQKALMFATINGKQTKVPAMVDALKDVLLEDLARELSRRVMSMTYSELQRLRANVAGDENAVLCEARDQLGQVCKDIAADE